MLPATFHVQLAQVEMPIAVKHAAIVLKFSKQAIVRMRVIMDTILTQVYVILVMRHVVLAQHRTHLIVQIAILDGFLSIMALTALLHAPKASMQTPLKICANFATIHA